MPDTKRGFSHVETWVFDLDNTLYPHHLNLWQQVDDRIRAFISDFLKVPHAVLLELFTEHGAGTLIERRRRKGSARGA